MGTAHGVLRDVRTNYEITAMLYNAMFKKYFVKEPLGWSRTRDFAPHVRIIRFTHENSPLSFLKAANTTQGRSFHHDMG